jgi:hypothetical protein
VNGAATTYVGWQWKESATAGFDIVTYTGNATAGRTVSHSLGVAPKMVIIKSRSLAGENWIVGHIGVSGGFGSQLLLNTTDAYSASGNFNGQAPTSSVFYVGSGTATNGNSATYVAYLFAEIPGFSKFGSYTGNGSTDGPFVYCGFRPKYVMVKASSVAGTWTVWDTARSTSNSTNLTLAPNNSNAESTVINIDVLSNGFKLRHVGDINGSGTTMIFAAFAENPMKYSNAR